MDHEPEGEGPRERADDCALDGGDGWCGCESCEVEPGGELGEVVA